VAGDDLVDWRPGVRTRLHVSAASGAEQLCVMEQWSEPGTGAPLHVHPDVEEVILVVEGAAEFEVDGVVSRVGAGEALRLPGGSWHTFRNAGDRVLHTVAIFGAAAPPVEYAEEPGVVYAIGGGGGRRRDAHRAVKSS
jgi:mannose-6-phosphate isomerase-like protein (cupin superfamily)